MPPPPTRKEQLQLDELLSDIYRGIEALPDKSAYSAYDTNISSKGNHHNTSGNTTYHSNNNNNNNSRSSSGIGGNKLSSSSQAVPADSQKQFVVGSRSHVKEYELPASSPIVKQHLASLREDLQQQQPSEYNTTTSQYPTNSSSKQPQRSTLKRNTTPDIYNQQQQQQRSAAPQSLASFVTSTPTPENKRRVRIVDHPEKNNTRGRFSNDQYNDDDDDEGDYAGEENLQENRKRFTSNKPEKVKYVNTNKLIYHDERLGSDEPVANSKQNKHQNNHSDENDDDDDDDLDGKTRVEYYHTTWLDRQLGRASKRRSSKELNERQVKEKAMIEELKRSLKSGAITLRQSLRGKKNKQPHNSTISEGNNSTDDYQIDSTLDSHNNNNNNNNYYTSSPSKHHHHHHKSSPSSSSNAIGSGLATIPRNYGSKQVYYPATPVCYDTWVNKTRGSTSPNSKSSDNHHHHHHHSHHHHNLKTNIAPYKSTTSGSFVIDNKQLEQYISEEPRNSYYTQSSSQQQTPEAAGTTTTTTTPKQISINNSNNNNNNYSNNYNSSTLNNHHRMQSSQYQTRQLAEQTTTPTSNLYSRTLPHKSARQRGEHSLIQSHLRGNSISRNYSPTIEPTKVNNSSTLPYSSASSATTAKETLTTTNSMRNPNYTSPTSGLKSPIQQQHQQSCLVDHQQLRQRPGGETINNIPSATEVVRSALSRSSSQVSLNQLNKTINLLPNSPPPFTPSPSGQTPTQQLTSLSPSPAKCNINQHQQQLAYNSAAQQQQQQQQRLYGTRTLDRNTMTPNQQQQQPQRQPIYANPHASLMQHKAEQQARQPARNTASIREFNELDNLLRSLSPAASSQYRSSPAAPSQYQPSSTTNITTATNTTAQITPGFSSKPAQSSLGGYGFTAPAATSVSKPTGNELYARIQKPATVGSIYQTPVAAAGDQSKASYLHQNYALANQQQLPQQQQQQQHQHPFTIDVTNKKADENCYKRQELSEFEAPIELLPSMEDYQNIAKLNPVKNHYWYKPNMSRDRAISLLKDKPQGTFIVRDSTSFRGAYGLALKVAKLPKNVLNNASLRNFNANDPSAELIRHFLIEPTPSGVRLKGYENEPVFNSLPDLIYQHSLTELALPCKLIIPRADIEDNNFNLKQKQFFDEFVASKEQAKHLPYERTSPNGGYRKYPGDVYVHNEHRIIFE